MSLPRLVVLASTFPARPDDGTPAFVLDLAQAEAQGFETTVIVPAVRGALSRERIGSVEVRRFRYFPSRWEDLADGAILENLRARPSRWLQVAPFLLAEWLAVRRAVRELRPDVLHVHWIIPQGIVALGVMGRIPSVVTTLGGDLYGLRNPVALALKRAVVSRAGALTTMNEDMRRQLVALGAPESRATVVPMGADLRGIRTAAEGVTRETGRLLFVGRLVEKKGLTHLVEALRLLDDPSLRLTVVGDGPLRRDLEDQATGLQVEFLGALGRTTLAQQYARATVMIVPSTRAASGDQDGLPVALLEAMGLGCPVVASDLPGINEVVLDGETGRLTPPGDPAALAVAIREVVGSPERAARLGAAARALSESLSVEAVGARYRDLLMSILTPQTDRPGRRGGRRPRP
ncbi:glycosyltransferase [Lapillicoccus sp.]|uniref:glycosyltransferase n=1 Tax=Lapillicoccus sp. TaxID=1909287 RepID=UPI0025CF505C|nr:glycosyltransferase [Lapillicoccus sp.]